MPGGSNVPYGQSGSDGCEGVCVGKGGGGGGEGEGGGSLVYIVPNAPGRVWEIMYIEVCSAWSFRMAQWNCLISPPQSYTPATHPTHVTHHSSSYTKTFRVGLHRRAIGLGCSQNQGSRGEEEIWNNKVP